MNDRKKGHPVNQIKGGDGTGARKKASLSPSSRLPIFLLFSGGRTYHENAVIGMLIKRLLSTSEGDFRISE
jgi:hypothetical protein